MKSDNGSFKVSIHHLTLIATLSWSLVFLLFAAGQAVHIAFCLRPSTCHNQEQGEWKCFDDLSLQAASLRLHTVIIDATKYLLVWLWQAKKKLLIHETVAANINSAQIAKLGWRRRSNKTFFFSCEKGFFCLWTAALWPHIFRSIRQIGAAWKQRLCCPRTPWTYL